MKTTLDIADALFARAKAHAKRTGQPLRAVVEEGLRRVLDEAPARKPYVYRDLSVGKPGDPNPFDGMTWDDIREEIYGHELEPYLKVK